MGGDVWVGGDVEVGGDDDGDAGCITGGGEGGEEEGDDGDG